MPKICLSKKIQKSKFHDFTHAWGKFVGKGYLKSEPQYAYKRYAYKKTFSAKQYVCMYIFPIAQ